MCIVHFFSNLNSLSNVMLERISLPLLDISSKSMVLVSTSLRLISKWHLSGLLTAQKIKFSIKNFFSKCDQIRRKLRIWSHLLKRSLMENLIFVQWYFILFLSNHLNNVSEISWKLWITSSVLSQQT